MRCKVLATSIWFRYAQQGRALEGDAEDKDNPLCVAARGGRLPLVRSLLRAGFRVNQKDHRGATPLIHAARFGHLVGFHDCSHGLVHKFYTIRSQIPGLTLCQDIVRELLAAGADINARDSYLFSALKYAAHFAAYSPPHAAIERLLRAKGAVADPESDSAEKRAQR
jgi:ankyrin repeat protein